MATVRQQGQRPGSGTRVRQARLARAWALAEHQALLAEVYVPTTRMLIKLDDTQLGWMAADRARTTAHAGNSPLVAAEAARNLAALARKAGWHEQAMRIALDAADHPTLHSPSPRHAAERGLLIQSAAYTAARAGDREGMRELTDEAAAMAARLGGIMLRDHGGGFGTSTVALHRISAENAACDPGAAVAAAHTIAPAGLPNVERRCRYHTDVATAYAHGGRRDQSLHALLNAERCSPEETHTRPAVRALVTGLLIGGRTTPELRALATRCAIT
ncbi:XRE family transcriptional regulator [Embleya sp. NBC_00896]|uniref:XRE family transcriptional regulator n=1 Tax=Embleya sp. NBC_00896 TaxID=2975961 RepID=UPI00386600CD|nr:XRE family transcriptional regulator [Embleya sp. NBC_00896]